MAEGCVEVAQDGGSARGWFLTPGIMTDVFGRDDRRNAGALWEYYGCDFVYRNGEWRYLHEHMCPVVNANYDTSNYGHGHELFASSDDNPDYTM